MFRMTSHNEPETLAIGRALAAAASPGDIIAIDGPLGAGKTRLVRGIALGLGLGGSVVSSPTFVLVNEYQCPPAPGDHPHTHLLHIDAYRLSGPDDLDTLGWDRILDSGAVVAIEWAERLGGELAALGTEHRLWRVRMEPVAGEAPSTRRAIEIDAPAARGPFPGEEPADLARLAAILSDPAPAAAKPAAVPRGWTRCPTTGRPVPPDSATFPFVDERARMADLGRWMSGAYAISREITEDDEGDVPPTRMGQ